MTTVCVAAGSNIDAPAKLRLAIAEIEKRFGPLQISKAYRNSAVGFEGPDFINLALRFDSNLDLPALIGELHAVEALCGRERGALKWASRAMDLDVLLFGDLICDTPQMRLPRPDLLRRAYMLGPLAELAGELRHPTAGKTIGQLWSEFDRAAHPLIEVDLSATAT